MMRTSGVGNGTETGKTIADDIARRVEAPIACETQVIKATETNKATNHPPNRKVTLDGPVKARLI